MHTAGRFSRGRGGVDARDARIRPNSAAPAQHPVLPRLACFLSELSQTLSPDSSRSAPYPATRRAVWQAGAHEVRRASGLQPGVTTSYLECTGLGAPVF